MDSKMENYAELWAAKRAEYDAKAEKLDAEMRLEYNDVFNNFGNEVAAATDWTEATWSEMMAKADQAWQKFALKMND